MSSIDPARLDAAYRTALDALMKERHPDGYWVGELSSSALSTATAVMALHLCSPPAPRVDRAAPATIPHDPDAAVLARSERATLIERGLAWLIDHQNPDGGWGDTVKSFSNISTTMLCRAALTMTQARSGSESSAASLADASGSLKKAETWLFERYGNTPQQLAEAVRARYGKDRTFATPILTTCALAGLVDWKEVPPLPFELACFPQSWFRFLRLHVVSYALPALIAIGQCIYHYRPPRNPITRLARRLARRKSLAVLERIQPSSGGYLEAIPLTSFVTLSLAACGLADHPVAKNGVRFLINSVRPDGSWAIDSNLSTWVTTLAINALAAAGELNNLHQLESTRDWLVKQQYREPHPYTGADPGGWAWTPLSGGVPDADDTPGSLIALGNLKLTANDKYELRPFEIGTRAFAWPIAEGITWLCRLQNSDGGWPTFCRGWGQLAFDRSGPDLTAHVMRAIVTYFLGSGRRFDPNLKIRWKIGRLANQERAIWNALQGSWNFLLRSQRRDGSWLPLWFGNQHMPDDENPTYGTARVLAAYRDLGLMHEEPARRGVAWLLANQNDDGGWGGGRGTPSSVEETSLAVEVLLDVPQGRDDSLAQDAASAKRQAGLDVSLAVARGVHWLIDRVERGDHLHPTPIGFYFAKLWYYEKLYPIIFAVAALGRARIKLGRPTP